MKGADIVAVKSIKETSTGKNIMFQDTGNHHKMTLDEFVKKIELIISLNPGLCFIIAR